MTEAVIAQRRAARPDASSWVSANAGSGKTRVLTDRVARLLLAGTEPQRILCLTYTKAAAAEMQNRLFRTLGAWAMLGDAELRAALRDLGEPGDSIPPARLDTRAHAVRAGARDARRPAHPDDPRLLREPAAPLPARGRRRAAVRRARRPPGAGRCASRCWTRWRRGSADVFAGAGPHLGGADPDPLLIEIARHREAFAGPSTPRGWPRRSGPTRR